MTSPPRWTERCYRLAAALIVALPLCGQTLISNWTLNTPLPEASSAAAVARGSSILVFAENAGDVGTVGQSGIITNWRSIPKPPDPLNYSSERYVVVGDSLLFASWPNSYIADFLPDDSISAWRAAPGVNPLLNSDGNHVVSDGVNIWSIGGCCLGTPDPRLSTVDVATFSNGTLSTWRSLGSFPIPIQSAALSLINGYLYVYGGLNANANLVVSRDVRRAQVLPGGNLGPWQFVGLLAEPRPHGERLSYQGTTHLVAGGVHAYSTQTVESSLDGNLGLGLFTYSAPLPVSRHNFGKAVVRNFGFVIGGCASAYCATKSNAIYTAVLGPGDLQAPISTSTLLPAANAAGWNNTNVSVQLSAIDEVGGSGVRQIQYSASGAQPVAVTIVPGSAASTAITAEGITSVTYFASDNAGNAEPARSLQVRIDRTAPGISAVRTPLANAAGWNNTDVVVMFTCTDSLSGVVSPGSQVVLNTSGAGQSATGTCTDLAGNTASLVVSGINIDKSAPSISGVNASPNPQIVGASAILTAQLSDSLSGISRWQYTLNGGTPAVQSAAGQNVTVSDLFTRSSPGVYNVCATAFDLADNASADECFYVVFYDPSGGFVTGGGWFTSTAGSLTADPTVSGKATFGFVSKYQNGNQAPTGNTEFQLKMANFVFRSTSYDWLVVSGARAQFRGSGSINSSGDYEFTLTAIDGDVNGGGGIDKFRIKIRQKGSGGVIYDNQQGDADSAQLNTALGGGSIQIHP